MSPLIKVVYFSPNFHIKWNTKKLRDGRDILPPTQDATLSHAYTHTHTHTHRHKMTAPQKYMELEQRMRSDPRLAPLFSIWHNYYYNDVIMIMMFITGILPVSVKTNYVQSQSVVYCGFGYWPGNATPSPRKDSIHVMYVDDSIITKIAIYIS